MELRRRYVTSAAFIAFLSWALASYWAPSLRFAPVAFLLGAVVTLAAILWVVISTAQPVSVESDIRETKSRNVAFVAPSVWQAEKAALRRHAQYKPKPLYPQSLIISDTLDTILEYAQRDFVSSWFGKVSSRMVFQNEVDRTLRIALSEVRDRLLRIDTVDMVMTSLLPIITTHLRRFSEAEKAIRGHKLTNRVTESDELDLAIAAKYGYGKLHPAVGLGHSNTKLVQQQHLRDTVNRLLPELLPSAIINSRVVASLVREVLANALLLPVMQLLSDPDSWNQLLEAYGRVVLQDRKTVRKLRAALDEHAPASPKSPKAVRLPRLSADDNERKFEKFVRAIRQCSNLSDARRFRSEVASQLRKESAVENQDQTYLRRLNTGKHLLDQRVASLDVGGPSKTRPAVPADSSLGTIQHSSKFENYSLRDVLHDATGMSYFMEYMDRMKLMRLVQFWLVVDSFRNPLEEDTDEPGDSVLSKSSWSSSDRMDLAQINEGYLSQPELKIASEYRAQVQSFLKSGSKASIEQYRIARQAVLKSQTLAYETMQDPYFISFKKSDLFFKWLAASDAITSSKVSRSSRSLDLHRNGDQSQVDGISITSETPVASAVPGHLQPAAISLRRAAASSSDLRSNSPKRDSSDFSVRRSLDDATRAPLFDDDEDTDPLANSSHSFDSAPHPGAVSENEEHIVDAMQVALNDIMESGQDLKDADKALLFPDDRPNLSRRSESTRSSGEIFRPSSDLLLRKHSERPSIASLGLVGAPSRLGVFSDDDLFGEEEKFMEDEHEDSRKVETSIEDEIHEAAPGDLGLAEAIDGLTSEIERLTGQDAIIDTLTRKAELTNNAAELRILRKSKDSLQREIQRKELQRQQYIVQESDNSLYGRASTSIKSVMVGTSEDGREFAIYIVEVVRQAGDKMPAAVWVVARRFSEFHELNKQLRAKYPNIRNLEFPRRHVVMNLQKEMLQKRRVALEKWLSELLHNPAICRSREFRAFLSQQAITSDSPATQAGSKDFVTRVYNSVADGMEEFLGNMPALEQLSLAGQNIISAATSQLANSNSSPGTIATATFGSDEAEVSQAEAELAAFDTHKELEPFVKPICDLFLETFELNRESNWLRGRAIVVVLHQLLGGTIERKIRENVKFFTGETSIVRYLNLLKDGMWPDGKLRQFVKRTNSERVKSRKEAGVLLATLVPDLAGNVVGRQNALSASRRILAALNNERLNAHLAYTIFDELIDQLLAGRQ